jgi:hypothetical protein
MSAENVALHQPKEVTGYPITVKNETHIQAPLRILQPAFYFPL